MDGWIFGWMMAGQKMDAWCWDGWMDWCTDDERSIIFREFIPYYIGSFSSPPLPPTPIIFSLKEYGTAPLSLFLSLTLSP